MFRDGLGFDLSTGALRLALPCCGVLFLLFFS